MPVLQHALQLGKLGGGGGLVLLQCRQHLQRYAGEGFRRVRSICCGTSFGNIGKPAKQPS